MYNKTCFIVSSPCLPPLLLTIHHPLPTPPPPPSLYIPFLALSVRSLFRSSILFHLYIRRGWLQPEPRQQQQPCLSRHGMVVWWQPQPQLNPQRQQSLCRVFLHSTRNAFRNRVFRRDDDFHKENPDKASAPSFSQFSRKEGPQFWGIRGFAAIRDCSTTLYQQPNERTTQTQETKYSWGPIRYNSDKARAQKEHRQRAYKDTQQHSEQSTHMTMIWGDSLSF